MKTIKKQVTIACIILFSISINAQDSLMLLGSFSANIKLTTNEVEYQQRPIIHNQTFTYNFKGGEVLVEFKDNQHIEYYNNKKHSIKSTIVWISKNECIITLKEINLPNFPFKKGNSLKMVITEVRGNNVYYKSTLGGRTWKGKMKEVETTNNDYFASN
ncbi:hypothetical protein H9I45_07035 [Polaribacter haliotis]|uniref:Uncharacterized protein n=1 Tax=Polaribacter haliotis TaxID=1888915 RepID=A0A7L8AJJ3_9FLAO|nr:hypothetical protein [Polaribacter haliotis]QOD62188.1 hypothetical protein H9I45_07035 [Polaribacter haliotis]